MCKQLSVRRTKEWQEFSFKHFCWWSIRCSWMSWVRHEAAEGFECSVKRLEVGLEQMLPLFNPCLDLNRWCCCLWWGTKTTSLSSPVSWCDLPLVLRSTSFFSMISFRSTSESLLFELIQTWFSGLHFAGGQTVWSPTWRNLLLFPSPPLSFFWFLNSDDDLKPEAEYLESI